MAFILIALGAGGFSLGLKDAGFDIKFAVDNDAMAVATYRSNFRDVKVFKEDVRIFLQKLKDKNSPPSYQG